MTEKLISFGRTNAEFAVDFEDVAKLEGLAGLLPEGSSVSITEGLGGLTLRNNRRLLMIITKEPLDIFKVRKAIQTKIYT